MEGLIVMGEISREYIRFMKEQTRLPIIFLDFYDKELAEDAVICRQFLRHVPSDGTICLNGATGSSPMWEASTGPAASWTATAVSHKALLEHGEELPAEWLIEDRDRTRKCGIFRTGEASRGLCLQL